MRFVIDTQCLVWYLRSDSRLSRASKDLFDRRDPMNRIVIPTIVLAELLYLSRRLSLAYSFEEILKLLEKEEQFEIYPLSLPILREAAPLTLFDMHDSLIVATAIHLKLPLMTGDREIVESNRIQTLRP